MNWLLFVTKLPTIIQGAVVIVDKIKGAKGAEKKAAVVEAIPEAIELTEFAAGKDIFNDAEIANLRDAAIDAEAAALKARNALKAGILAKKPAA